MSSNSTKSDIMPSDYKPDLEGTNIKCHLTEEGLADDRFFDNFGKKMGVFISSDEITYEQ